MGIAVPVGVGFNFSLLQLTPSLPPLGVLARVPRAIPKRAGSGTLPSIGFNCFIIGEAHCGTNRSPSVRHACVHARARGMCGLIYPGGALSRFVYSGQSEIDLF